MAEEDTRASVGGLENGKSMLDAVEPPANKDDKVSKLEPQERREFQFAVPEISIAVDPVALITTECITVTSAMRKHVRWAQSSVSAILGGSSYRATTSTSPSHALSNSSIASNRRQSRLSITTLPDGTEEDQVASRWGLRGKRGKSLLDNPLMSAFARLRNDVKDCKGVYLWGRTLFDA